MNVVWTASAAEVVTAVADAVRQLQHGQPLRSVYVLTPPGSTVATLRRLLPAVQGPAGVTGIAGIRFTTAPDLALELAPVDHRRRRPITPLLLGAAVQAELNDRCPAVLRAVKDHAATVDALVQAANRLRSIRLIDDSVDVVNELAAGSDVRRAIVNVAVRARAELLAKGFRDEASLLVAAGTALATGVSRVAGPLVVVATDAFHPAQLAFLGQVLSAAPDVRVVAATPTHGDHDLAAQFSSLFGAAISAPDEVSAHVMSCPDQDEEARWVVRKIVALVTGPAAEVAEDIAVLYPPGSGYARSLGEELQRAGLHYSGPAVEKLVGSMAGQALRLLLDLFALGCDREGVLQLVAVAPLWPSEFPKRRNVAKWRRLCRQANVVGAADWSGALERLAAYQRRVRERRRNYDESVDLDSPSQQDEWDRQSLGSLIGLVAQVERSAAAFHRATTWTAAASVTLGELARHVGTVQWRQVHWADAPIWQRRAADQIEIVVNALSQFDEASTELSYSAGNLRRIVTTELAQQVRKAGDTTVGVRVLPLHHGICLDARHVFVTGVNEGVLPPSRIDDLVVPADVDAACTAVIEHADWHRNRLRRAWQALLRGGSDVTATYARSDLRRGGELFPSEWIAKAGADFSPPAHPSHAHGVLYLAPLTAAECAARRPGVGPVAASPVAHRNALALASRSQPQPTAFDGEIGAHVEHDPTKRVQSITPFETYAACPLDYFVKKVLSVDTETDPSEITNIESRERGTLVHGVLEHLVSEWLQLEPSKRPAWMQGEHLSMSLDRAAVLLDDAAVQLDLQHRLGHPTSWRIERTMIIGAIRATLEQDATERVSPVAAEFSFGVDPSDAAFAVELDDVGTLTFRGSVDRVDRIGNHLRVTDFKTSNAATKPRNGKDDFESGRKLQPGLYTRVVRQRAAVLDGSPEDAVDWQYLYLRRGHSEQVPVDAALLDLFDGPVSRAAARIRDGHFQSEVPGVWGCEVCSPDGLGLGDVEARAQQRNVFAERAAAADTAEGDDDGDGDISEVEG